MLKCLLHIACVLLVAGPALAQPVVESTMLDNGLVVASVRRPGPVAAVQLWVAAGSKAEPSDRRGLATVVQRLMARGSRRVRPGDHGRLLATVGGTTGTALSQDAVVYMNEVPASALRLALQLEADRLGSLHVTEAGLAEAKAEALAGVAAQAQQPFVQAVRALLPRLFEQHPYAWSEGGYADDIAAVTLEDAQRFYAANYVVSNALLVVVADLPMADISALVNQYFGAMPKVPLTRPRRELAPPVPSRLVGEPVSVSAVIAATRLPAATSPDVAAMQVAVVLLSGGPESRLGRRFLAGTPKGAAMALAANAEPMWLADGGALFTYAAYRGDAPVEAALLDELSKMQSVVASKAELARAKTHVRALAVEQMASASGLATRVGRGWTAWGKVDRNVLRDELANVAAVTAAEITRVSGQYLQPKTAAITILPGGAQ